MALAMKFTDETSTGSGEVTDCDELLAALFVVDPLEGGLVGDFRLALFRISTVFPFCERFIDTCKMLNDLIKIIIHALEVCNVEDTWSIQIYNMG